MYVILLNFLVVLRDKSFNRVVKDVVGPKKVANEQ